MSMDATPVDHDPFGSGEISRISPSTEPQREVIAAAAMSAEANTAYNEAVSLRIRGDIDVDVVERALFAIVDRHDALRTTFTPQLDALVVTSENQFVLERVDLTVESAERQGQILLETWRAVSATPMELCEGPLFRAIWLQYGPTDAELVLLAHHAVCDGWSFHVILKELSALCAAAPNVLAPAPSFATFAEQQQAREAENRDADYWLKRLADKPVALDLPTDRPRPARRTFAAHRLDHSFSVETTKAIAVAAGRMRASSVGVLLAGVASLLYRLTDQDDITLGMPVARQALAELPELVGHCVQLLPIRLKIDDAQRFEELVIQARSAVLDATEHFDFTFGGLVRGIGLSGDAARVPLIPVLVNVDQPLADLVLGGAVASVRTVPRTAEGFEIFLNVLPSASKWVIEATFNSDLFADETIAAWLQALESLMVAGAADPASQVRSLALTSGPSAAYQSFNATKVRVGQASWLECLEANAARRPLATAVVDAHGSMAYGELVRLARGLARDLIRRGVRRGEIVGLFTGRSRNLLVAMIGIHLAGAAHLPLDPEFPEARRLFQLEDTGARIVVIDNSLSLSPSFAPAGIELLNVEADLHATDGELALPTICPDDLAYVIYTSGSTGKPKGVRLQHGALTNLLVSVTKRPGFTAEDTLVAITTVAFDISLLELLVPLVVGGRVVIATREESESPGVLANLLKRHEATVMQATPATWRMLVDDQWAGQASLRAFCGGERLPRDLADSLLRRVGSLWNLYGPTETCVWSAGAKVQDSATAALVGTPFDNTCIFVLDRVGNLMPPGVPGEICIGGCGLAQGYQNLPQLTAARFFDHLELGRLYRTGDRGRLRASGTLECMGRIDQQVKVRGFRIELGEIETVLAEHPNIKEAAVAVVDGLDGGLRIVAYVVESSVLPPAELKAYLRGVLPEYMVPQQVVSLISLPRLPNGKLDRRSLPKPMASEVSADPAALSEPNTPTERIVVAEMCEVLKIGRMGVGQDFFDLGGHSLMAAQLVARLNRACDVVLSMRTVFESPTPRGLARAIQSGAGKGQARRIARRSEQRVSPVTHVQERIWFMEQMLGGGPAYNLPSAHRLVGRFDAGAFVRAFQAVVDRQTVLRTTFERRAGQLLQIVHDGLQVELLPIEDLSELPQEERQARLMARLQQLSGIPFDLSRLPLFSVRLFRLAEQEHVLFFMPHHIVWDGWSFDILYEELADTYGAFTKGRSDPRPELPISYGDYAAWHRDLLAGPDAQRQAKIWRERLGKFGAVERLPIDHRGGVGMLGEGSTEWVTFDEERTSALHDLARDNGATLFVTMLSLYGVLLHGYARQSRLLLATPVRGRESVELESLMGCCNSLLPLPIEIRPDETFEAMVARAKAIVLESLANPDVLLEQIVASKPSAYDAPRSLVAGGGVLYQALFSFQDVRRRRLQWGELEHSMIHLFQKGATEDLGLWFVEGSGGLQGGLTYNANVLTRETALRLREGLGLLVDAVIENPGVRVAALAERIGWDIPVDHTASPRPTLSQAEGESANDRPRVGGKVLSPDELKDYEFVLLRIWEKVLCRDRVTVHDDFFELGGNSLAAIQCVVEFESATGITIDLGELFRAPTIAALVTNIGAGIPHAQAMLIPLQAEGEGIPLFCLLGIQVYRHLANGLGKEHPTYGVYVREEQALVGGSGEERFPVASIDRLATAYCEVIRKACPKGPLRLAGVSYGGVIAMEVAKRLTESGAQVDCVLLLDTILPGCYRRSWIRWLGRSVTKAWQLGIRGTLQRLATRLGIAVHRRDSTTDAKDENGETAGAFRMYVRAMEGQIARWVVDLKRPSWRVVLLRANDSSAWGSEYEFLPDYGWGPLLGDRLTLIRVDGDHLGILAPPHVDCLVAELRKCLPS